MPQFALLSARACGLRAAAAGAAAAGDAAAAGAGADAETAAVGAAGAVRADAAADFGAAPAPREADAGDSAAAGACPAADCAARGADPDGVAAGAAPARGADEAPARRALAGCISEASPPVDHWGVLAWVRTFVGGSSMGSSNCSDSESRDADTFEPDAGAGSGPHPGHSAISAMTAPEKRRPEHGPAAFMKGCRGGA